MGSSRQRFVVVGGGIGGLVAALALARAGQAVQVLEKAQAFGEIGAGIQLAPNASRVLDRLGVLGAVTADAFFPRRLVLMDAVSGDELTSLDIDDDFVRTYGYPYFVTHRADLHRALLDACESEPLVTLLPGSEVVEIVETEGAVLGRCANGASYEADAVIGADGLWSTTRATVFGLDGPPRDSGYVAYRGTVPMPDVSDAAARSLVDCMVIWLGPHYHLVQYPVRRGQLRNQVAVFDTQIYGRDTDDHAEQLRQAFAGCCRTVAAGVRLLDTSRRWAMMDRDPIQTWVSGRVALLGDAAHPMLQYLAQGACQAIEDAIVLADTLQESDGSITDAFSRYQAARIPRTERVQLNARRFGDVLHAGGMAAAMRNALFATRSPTDSGPVHWLYAPGAERASEGEPPIPVRVASAPGRPQAS
jgi:2-polyprenyl-6-methoxyphenol hydroxylase-like FAD-dependent oxidoreductase